ncbi:MAG: DUF1674 domain-containing protein [Sulfitobacter sp.]
MAKPPPTPAPDLPPQPKPSEKPIPDAPQHPRPEPEQDLPPAARRALAEAEERRKKTDMLAMPNEVGGRDGPEPVRYGDWEKKGLAVDF